MWKWKLVSFCCCRCFIYAFKVFQFRFSEKWLDLWSSLTENISSLLITEVKYDWPIFMISASNQQLQQQLEYTLLKPDCHSCWISKIQSGREEERYAIKFCFKLRKDATEMYGMLQTARIKHQFLSGIRDSRKAGILWGIMRGMEGVRKSIH